MGTPLLALVWELRLPVLLLMHLDQLSKMVFFPDLHCHGMGLCPCHPTDYPGSSAGRIRLAAGSGIIYTVGGVIYALKLPIFNSRHKYFGSHEIFHLFVMGGSFCHYIMMYAFVA